MPGNDFDNVPQCLQIPATEKPEFFAVRSDPERRCPVRCATDSPAQPSLKARAPASSSAAPYTITSFLAVLVAVLESGGVRPEPVGSTDYAANAIRSRS